MAMGAGSSTTKACSIAGEDTTMQTVMKKSKGATEEEAQKEVGGVTIRSSMMLIVTKLQLNSDFT